MPSQRAVDRLHRIAAGEIGIVAHPGLVELDHVGAGLLQVERLGVDGFGERHRQLLVVLVEFVLGLLAHGERAGQGDLGGMVGVLAQELHVAQLDRPGALDLADHARHRRLVAVARDDDGGIVGVDAFERGGKAVGIALAADLAVGDDVDAGALHVADRDDGRVVLRFFEMLFRQPPHLVHARARHGFRQHGAVDQPFRLRIASDHGGRQQMFRQVHGLSPVASCCQVAGCSAARRDVFRRALAAARAGLPDRGLALEQADEGIEGNRHREHQQHAGEHMRAVEDGAVARDQIADAGRRDQHFRDDHADDDQRAADAQARQHGRDRGRNDHAHQALAHRRAHAARGEQQLRIDGLDAGRGGEHGRQEAVDRRQRRSWIPSRCRATP